MNVNITRITRGSLATLALASLMVACQKNNDTPASPGLSISGRTAVVNTITSQTIYGIYGDPSVGASDFGIVYYNIATGAQDSTGNNISANLTFSGFDNGTIGKVSSADTLKVLNTYTAYGSLTLKAYYDSAQAVSSYGMNTGSTASNPSPFTANGWWNYNATTHFPQPTSNVAVFFRPAGSSTIYALQLTGATGEGIASYNRGVFTFSRGSLQ